MAFDFHAEPNPSQARCAEVAAYAPANPFYTPAYVEARRLLGVVPWILALRRDGQLVSACTAFMQSNVLGRSLAISSLPALPEPEIFWQELQRFCRKARVSSLTVNSAMSPRAQVPSLPGETGRRVRYEYVLELPDGGLWDRLPDNHRRNIQRGRKAGLHVRRAVDEYACQEHARLMSASLERRRNRGETVPTDVHARTLMAYIRTGAGELSQAVRDNAVLSSLLVLLAERGAYYQSAGTSPEGMACGASPFLVYETALTLQSRSVEVFNLGGVDQPDSGLGRFKGGFATKVIQLEAAEFFLGSTLRKWGIAIARLARDLFAHVPRQVLRRRDHSPGTMPRV